MSERKFHEPVKDVILRGVISIFRALGKPLPVSIRNFHIIDTYDRAVIRYKTKSYAGRVTQIKTHGSPGSADMGWAELVTGELLLRDCVGDHYSMIKEPHVQQLAAVMTEAMATVHEQPSIAVK